LRYPVLALIVVLLVAQVARAELPRHTPGFPDVTDWQWLESVLKDPRLLEALRALTGSELGYRELLESLIHRETLPPGVAGELTGSLNRSLDDLVVELGDPRLRALVEAVEGAGVNREDLVTALEYLDRLRSSGVLDLPRYVALLVGLADALRERGFEVPPELLGRLGKVLTELLSPLQLSRVQLVGGSANPEPSLPRPEFRVATLGLQLPALSVPWLPLGYLIIALVATAAVVLVLRTVVPRLPRLGWLRTKLTTSPAEVTEVGELGVVELYWRAVELISRATNTPYEDHTTHREYLARLARLVGEPLLGSFSALTQTYELYRYGGVRDEAVVGLARTAYRRVVESLGKL
jgi:hypothetical protein